MFPVNITSGGMDGATTDRTTRPFTPSVTMTMDGAWATIVDFGGATLTRLFDKQDAGAYGGKLAMWLATRPPEWIRG